MKLSPGEFGCRQPTVVYNAFPWSDRDSIDGLSKDRGDRRLPSIHWFSQTLGPGRGLEDLVAALPLLKSETEVHLRGRPALGFENWLIQRIPEGWRARIKVHQSVSNSELLSRIAEHDIGFAGETSSIRSRNLTVTNKILLYLLGGLAVVASETAGQREVALQAPGSVLLYPSGDASALASCLDELLGVGNALASQDSGSCRREENILLGASGESTLGVNPTWSQSTGANIAMTSLAQFFVWLGNRFGKPRGVERIVRWFASPEKCASLPELCLVRDGLVFLARPGVQVDWHVLFFGSYEPEVRRIFRTVLPLGGVAIDVGANVGWHTLLMASLVGARGRVLAIEPNPDLRQRLHDHLCLNRCEQVNVISTVAADTEGMVEFYAPALNDRSSGNGHVVDDALAMAGTIRVAARSLDTIVAEARCERLDLIKIDVEGFEWRVLRGGADTIAKFRPHIIFEYNTEYAARGGGTPQLLGDFFRTHRYRLFAIGRNWAEAIQPDRWPASHRYLGCSNELSLHRLADRNAG